MDDKVSNSPGGAVWGPRLGRWSLALTGISLAVAAIGLTLARCDFIAKLAGFTALLGGGLLALLAVLLGSAALVVGRKDGLSGKGRLIAALGISMAFSGFLASRPLTSGDAPPIHDITTDLADPPGFATLALREDNLAGVGTIENWRKIHAAAYGDLVAITIPKPVPVVTANAVRLAKEAGWHIAASDIDRGHVEATASVSYIRFQDDVAIRVAPTQDGKGSRIDVRSVSRVGVGDLGVNARRIRDFLDALAAA